MHQSAFLHRFIIQFWIIKAKQRKGIFLDAGVDSSSSANSQTFHMWMYTNILDITCLSTKLVFFCLFMIRTYTLDLSANNYMQNVGFNQLSAVKGNVQPLLNRIFINPPNSYKHIQRSITLHNSETAHPSCSSLMPFTLLNPLGA